MLRDIFLSLKEVAVLGAGVGSRWGCGGAVVNEKKWCWSIIKERGEIIARDPPPSRRWKERSHGAYINPCKSFGMGWNLPFFGYPSLHLSLINVFCACIHVDNPVFWFTSGEHEIILNVKFLILFKKFSYCPYQSRKSCDPARHRSAATGSERET
jgi:hypothetical protein